MHNYLSISVLCYKQIVSDIYFLLHEYKSTEKHEFLTFIHILNFFHQHFPTQSQLLKTLKKKPFENIVEK